MKKKILLIFLYFQTKIEKQEKVVQNDILSYKFSMQNKINNEEEIKIHRK